LIESEGTPRAPSNAAPQDEPRAEARAAGVFVIGGAIDRNDIPALCARVTRFIAELDDHAEVVVSELAPTVTPSSDTVEALARLQLTALRLGCRLRLGPCCADLRALLDHIGFGEVIPHAWETADEAGPPADQDGSHV